MSHSSYPKASFNVVKSCREQSLLVTSLRRGIASHSTAIFYCLISSYGTIVLFAFRHFVPVWDGWNFYGECFVKAASSGSCSCFGHTAYFPTIGYGLLVRAFPYNFTLMAAVNLLIGLITCFVFARSFSLVTSAPPLRCHVATSLLLLSPAMFVQLIQPGLDYLLAMLTALLVASCLTNKRALAVAIGCLMASTKEPGIMLYGVTLCGYLLVVIHDEYVSSGLWSALKLTVRHSFMILPLLLFAFYAMAFGLHSEPGMPTILQGIFVFEPDSDLLIAQLLSLFVLNFNWLITLGVVILGLLLATSRSSGTSG